MATIKRFEDLEIWQESRRLATEIIVISSTTELRSDYKLSDQIKGSSGSVMDYIAQGFERDVSNEFRQFLSLAKESAGATRSQLYRVFDAKYIDEKTLKILINDYETLSKRISSFINYLDKKDFKDSKHRESKT
ncbi:four helix bundle protein [Aquimarina sp. RZ0]|uniref:four helix bundle protein n=1 Tax=Aquimarina sp. RZ0 TaxID=2607730 RepID=UPI0011F18D57|nr:four helix bundle protein [Aquimarina sp. RZ0]KAA1247273.1 four helix bundle protein [Aquimarina sp. RZ0]